MDIRSPAALEAKAITDYVRKCEQQTNEIESLRAKLAEAEKFRELVRRQVEEGFVTTGELHDAIQQANRGEG